MVFAFLLIHKYYAYNTFTDGFDPLGGLTALTFAWSLRGCFLKQHDKNPPLAEIPCECMRHGKSAEIMKTRWPTIMTHTPPRLETHDSVASGPLLVASIVPYTCAHPRRLSSSPLAHKSAEARLWFTTPFGLNTQG